MKTAPLLSNRAGAARILEEFQIESQIGFKIMTGAFDLPVLHEFIKHSVSAMRQIIGHDHVAWAFGFVTVKIQH